jgi:hypothetical protein
MAREGVQEEDVDAAEEEQNTQDTHWPGGRGCTAHGMAEGDS